MISICRSSTLIWRLSFLTLLFNLTPALAQQPLFFKKLYNHAHQAAIVRYLDFAGIPINADIADVDLNGDGLNEYILKFPDRSLLVLAFMDKHLISLGRIEKTSGLLVSDQEDYGVRRLVVHGTPTDDFATVSYRWNPRTQRYEKQ